MRSRLAGLLAVLAVVIGLTVAGPAPPVAAAAGDRTWLALGDSYSAGTGIRSELLLRNAAGDDCRRATGQRADGSPSQARAWAVSAFEAVRQEHGFASLDFVPCDDAVTDDVEAQITEATGTTPRTWDVVTLGIGGNNIGFKAIIEDCLDLPTSWTGFLSPGCGPDLLSMRLRVHALLGGLGENQQIRGNLSLPDLYDRVAEVVTPGGFVVVAGYPNLIETPANWLPWRGHSRSCSGFPRDDIDTLREGLTFLNSQIEEAAAAAERRSTTGVRFVFLDVAEVYENASGRHGLCSTDPWLNGTVLGLNSDGPAIVQPVLDHSFHPTRSGYDATGAALAALFGSEIVFVDPPVDSPPSIPVGLGVPTGPPIALPRQVWSPVGESPIEDGSTPGSFRVGFYDLYWGGARTAPAVGCDYTLDGSARVVDGDGYGFAVRADLGAGPDPVAQGFQYDPGAGGYRDTQYPASEGGAVRTAATDQGWHQFSLSVLGDRYEARIDGAVVGSGVTALSCGELYLRLWRGTAEFRDLTVTPIGPGVGDEVRADFVGVWEGTVEQPSYAAQPRYRAVVTIRQAAVGGAAGSLDFPEPQLPCAGADLVLRTVDERELEADEILRPRPGGSCLPRQYLRLTRIDTATVLFELYSDGQLAVTGELVRRG